MNRALRRRAEKLPDVRLWDNDPWWVTLGMQPSLAITVPVEDWTSEQTRDAYWADAHDWQFTYFPDGSKTAATPQGKTIRFPVDDGAYMRMAA